MNTSVNTIKIPSISGMNARDGGKLFAATFWKDVPMDPQTKDWKIPRPLIGGIGSLGLGHCTPVDLSTLWLASNKDEKIFETLIKENWKDETVGRRHHDVEALKAFFSFAEGSQPHFFLRNGQTILGLCKKIGGYFFDLPAEDPARYPHRIHFEFLRHATQDEQNEFNMVILGAEKRLLKDGTPRIMTGKIRSFMNGSTLVLPVEPVVAVPEATEVVDPAIRRAEISKELAAITETMKALVLEQEKLMKEDRELEEKMKPVPAPAPAPSPPPPDWRTKVLDQESVLLTKHANGIPDAEELKAPQFKIRVENGVFKEFVTPFNTQFSTPSGLCCAFLRRNGATNQWQGPKHCLVLRNGIWTPLAKL